MSLTTDHALQTKGFRLRAKLINVSSNNQSALANSLSVQLNQSVN